MDVELLYMFNHRRHISELKTQEEVEEEVKGPGFEFEEMRLN